MWTIQRSKQNKKSIQKIQRNKKHTTHLPEWTRQGLVLTHIAYRDYEDLPRRTASVKVLRDKAFAIASNPKYDGYKRGLASIVYKLFENYWH